MNGNSIGANLGNGQAEEVAREAGNPQAVPAAPVSRESRNQSDRSDHLWCVHIIGPDDLYAAPNEAEARRAVGYMEAHWKKIEPDSEVNRMVSFEAIPWPHSAESHARDVGRFYSEIGLPSGGKVL